MNMNADKPTKAAIIRNAIVNRPRRSPKGKLDGDNNLVAFFSVTPLTLNDANNSYCPPGSNKYVGKLLVTVFTSPALISMSPNGSKIAVLPFFVSFTSKT